MTWNYRVIKHTQRKPNSSIDDELSVRYAVHEVFYDEDSGNIWGITGVPADVVGSDVEFIPGSPIRELRKDVAMMLLAFDKPVLNWEDYDDEPCEYWRKGIA